MTKRAKPIKKPPTKLTIKQRLFVSAYLANGYNATQAAREAGYKGNDVTLGSVGTENLHKPLIAAAIHARVTELDKQYEHRIAGRYEVLARLTDIARGDIGDIDVSSSEAIRRAKESGKSHLIKKVREQTFINAAAETETHTFELELYSAQDALVTLAKHHKLLTERVEVVDWRQEAERLGIKPSQQTNILLMLEAAYEEAAAAEETAE